LLKKKAIRLREETGDDRWIAPIELKKVTFKQRVLGIVAKPFRILFTEPMLIAITVYMSFVYGVLVCPLVLPRSTSLRAVSYRFFSAQYLLFEAYPVVFGPGGHNFRPSGIGLAFIPFLCGALAGVLSVAFYFNPHYSKLVDQHAPNPVPPEHRLPPGILGGAALVVGFFWFGWTSYPSISFWCPMVAGSMFGLCCLLNFVSTIK
jgi:hypothetical protein